MAGVRERGRAVRAPDRRRRPALAKQMMVTISPSAAQAMPTRARPLWAASRNMPSAPSTSPAKGEEQGNKRRAAQKSEEAERNGQHAHGKGDQRQRKHSAHTLLPSTTSIERRGDFVKAGGAAETNDGLSGSAPSRRVAGGVFSRVWKEQFHARALAGRAFDAHIAIAVEERHAPEDVVQPDAVAASIRRI